MILFSEYLASLTPPSTRSLTRLLWSSQTENCSNNFGTSCSSVWPSMFYFRQSLKIGDCTTCGLCIIKLYRDFFIWSFIFEFPVFFGFNAQGVVQYLIDLHFDLEYLNRRVAVFFFTSNMLAKRHSDLLALGFLTGVDFMGNMRISLMNL